MGLVGMGFVYSEVMFFNNTLWRTSYGRLIAGDFTVAASCEARGGIGLSLSCAPYLSGDYEQR